MKSKRTLILGASPNSMRYSNIATLRLIDKNHPVFPVGIHKGKIGNVSIITDRKKIENIDTLTLYIGAKNQEQWFDYILSTKPKRVIFNPGTENPVLEKLLLNSNIETETACTLVLLSIGNY